MLSYVYVVRAFALGATPRLLEKLPAAGANVMAKAACLRNRGNPRWELTCPYNHAASLKFGKLGCVHRHSRADISRVCETLTYSSIRTAGNGITREKTQPQLAVLGAPALALRAFF